MQWAENMYEKSGPFFPPDPHIAAEVTQTPSGLQDRSLKTN
jgi:hypothetical protein